MFTWRRKLFFEFIRFATPISLQYHKVNVRLPPLILIAATYILYNDNSHLVPFLIFDYIWCTWLLPLKLSQKISEITNKFNLLIKLQSVTSLHQGYYYYMVKLRRFWPSKYNRSTKRNHCPVHHLQFIHYSKLENFTRGSLRLKLEWFRPTCLGPNKRYRMFKKLFLCFSSLSLSG